MPECCTNVHPQVPQSNVVAMLSYCHQCMSFRLAVNSYSQLGEELSLGPGWGPVEFGPFDTFEEINAVALEAFDQVLNKPGAPWDAVQGYPG